MYRRVRSEAGDAGAELRCGGLVGHVRGQVRTSGVDHGPLPRLLVARTRNE